MYLHNSTVSDIQGKRIEHTVDDHMEHIRSASSTSGLDSKIWISESVSTSSHFIPSLPTVPKVSRIQLQVRLRRFHPTLWSVCEVGRQECINFPRCLVQRKSSFREHRGLSTRTRIWEVSHCISSISSTQPRFQLREQWRRNTHRTVRGTVTVNRAIVEYLKCNQNDCGCSE